MAYSEALEVVNKTGIGEVIPNIDSYNHIELLGAIIRLNRYDLLSFNTLKLDIKDDDLTRKLIRVLMKDRDIMYELNCNGLIFSKDQLDIMRLIAFEKYCENYNYYGLFDNTAELDMFVRENQDLFIKYINSKGSKDYIYSDIYSSNEFVKLLFSLKRYEFIDRISSFSPDNFKNLLVAIDNGFEVKNDYFTNDILNMLFENKNQYSKDEFLRLLKMFVDIDSLAITYGKELSPNDLIKENIDYLIELFSGKTLAPVLATNTYFRGMCIEKGKIDLAVQCILPLDILNNPKLVSLYANELHLTEEEFTKKVEWIINYSKKNRDIFNLFIPTMLKSNLKIEEHHFERMINDPAFELLINELNGKEIKIVNRLLANTNYKTYDTSFMIRNVIKNINKYSNLINSLDLNNLSDKDFVNLIVILQDMNNYYDINSYEELKDFESIKKRKYMSLIDVNDIRELKQGMVKYLFSINLNMAELINKHYCYNRDGNVIDKLATSELLPKDFAILKLLNDIIECNDINVLKELYSSNMNIVYSESVPLETYLRKEYSDLYRNATYRVDGEDKIKPQRTTVDYDGSKVDICLPRDSFYFLIHCVGTCSYGTDGENYKSEWEDFPQVRDHFVACSLINNIHLNTRDGSSIIYGFGNLEGSSLIGMGDTDIDSIGYCAREYGGGMNIVIYNNTRAHFFTPSLMLEKPQGYNEIVIERRDNKGSLEGQFKRSPDYIISIINDANDKSNFMVFDDLIKLEYSFLNNDEIDIIRNAKSNKEMANVLLNHANELFNKDGLEYNESLVKKIVKQNIERINNSKKYEDNLKAASSFNIPLVVVDKAYYFRKMVTESVVYDEETKNKIIELYDRLDSNEKKELWKKVSFQKSYEEITKKQERRSFVVLA